MAVVKKHTDEKVSSDLIKCSAEEALEYQATLIKEWTPAADVWAFRYGPALLTGSAVVSIVYIADRFQKKFKLNKPGRIGVLFPAVVTPIIVLPLLHHKLVTENVLLQNACPLCLSARAAAIQVGLGVCYPLLVAPIASSVLAYSFITDRLPELTWKNVPAYYELCKKYIRPRRNVIIGLGIANALAGLFVVDSQTRNLCRLAKLIEEKENTALN